MRRCLLLALGGLIAALGLLSADHASAENGAWGTVSGRIVFTGPIPARKKINVNGHQDANFCLKDGAIESDELIVSSKNKGVRWVLVWLEPLNAQGKLPIHPALQALNPQPTVLDQPCCQFIPH